MIHRRGDGVERSGRGSSTCCVGDGDVRYVVQVVLWVISESNMPLTGHVVFHLHPSFQPATRTVPVVSDRATT